MLTVIPMPATIVVPVAGSDANFPVRRIYCVGRNYAAHAREMGGDPTREPPFFFCKPADAIVVAAPGRTVSIAYPSASRELHHEIELVVAIGQGGRDIAVERALAHVYGYAVGLDMTRRDLQAQMKKQGRPWEVGKAFDQSAPIGLIHAAEDIGHPARGAIWVQVDGVDRQRSDIDQLVWTVPEVIANLSTLFTLQPGDLIYTGTPEGVAAVERGQTMRGGIDGLGEISVQVENAANTTQLPSFEAFEGDARARGFDEVIERRWANDLVLDTHTHSFDVDALVTQGEMWLTCGEQTRHLRAGERFTLDRDLPHAERYGAEGAIVWVARRHRA
jgi:fumarylpyruvate hydrolase